MITLKFVKKMDLVRVFFWKNNILCKAIVLIVIISCALFAYFFLGQAPQSPSVNYGITFSTIHARNLGLNTQETYSAILNDLGTRSIRLPLYWNEIELQKGVYNFEEFDWYIQEAEKYGAKIIPVMGRKSPRWPECFLPEWGNELKKNEQQSALLRFISEAVTYYRKNENIIAWQIENEPFFEFGECELWEKEFLEKEIRTVKLLDNRPIMVTESGEWGTWVGAARRADIVGSTLYRTSWWNKLGIKEFVSPIPPIYYFRKANLINLLYKKPVIISEFQLEPWGPRLIQDLSLEEQLRYMNLERLKDNIAYSKKTGFNTIYLWGAEWWYYMKLRGHPEFWNETKSLFQNE